MRSHFEQIYDIVRLIPAGKVATYGHVARLAGMPRGARTVGWALRAAAPSSAVPWQRVINSRGAISLGAGQGGAELQRALLESEGVVFDEKGRVDLKLYGWEGIDLAERDQLLNLAPDD